MKNLYQVSVLYLLLPLLLFYGFWLRLSIAIPVIFGLVFISYKYFRSLNFDSEIKISSSDFFKLSTISILLTFLSGVGNYTDPMGDFIGHNAKFYTLITYNWPVIIPEKNQYLVYYLGYYIVPAFFSKIFNTSSYFFLIVWTFLGFLIGLTWLYIIFNKKIIYFIILFIFSGLSFHLVYYINKYGLYNYPIGNSIQFYTQYFQLNLAINQFIPTIIISGIILYYSFSSKLINCFLPICLGLFWQVYPSIIFCIIYILLYASNLNNTNFVFGKKEQYMLLISLFFIPLLIFFLSSSASGINFILKTIHTKRELFDSFAVVFVELFFIITFLGSLSNWFTNKIDIPNWFILTMILTFPIYCTFKAGVNNDWIMRGAFVYYVFFSVFAVKYMIIPGFNLWKISLAKQTVIVFYLFFQLYFFLEFLYLRPYNFFTGHLYGHTEVYKPLEVTKYPNIYKTLRNEYTIDEAEQYLGRKNSLFEKYFIRK